MVMDLTSALVEVGKELVIVIVAQRNQCKYMDYMKELLRKIRGEGDVLMSIKQMCKSVSIYETALNELRKGIIEEIAERLSQVDLPDVKRISSSPRIVIVKASTLFANNWNMSAEYYISESQTKVLIEKIRNKVLISDIVKFINEVIANGYIRIDSRNKMFINNAVKAELISIAEELKEVTQ